MHDARKAGKVVSNGRNKICLQLSQFREVGLPILSRLVAARLGEIGAIMMRKALVRLDLDRVRGREIPL